MRRINFPSIFEVVGCSSRLTEPSPPQPIWYHNNTNEGTEKGRDQPQSIRENLICPPIIAEVDLVEETFVIFNPNPPNDENNGIFHLEKWSVSDGRKQHVHTFGSDCWLLPGMKLHVYTCPGKTRQTSRTGFSEPYVLWTNKDGSLRKKEILNNDSDAVYLFDNFGECKSYCQATRGLADVQNTQEVVTSETTHIIHQGIVEIFPYDKDKNSLSLRAVSSNFIKKKKLLFAASLARFFAVSIQLLLLHSGSDTSLSILFYWVAMSFDITLREMCPAVVLPIEIFNDILQSLSLNSIAISSIFAVTYKNNNFGMDKIFTLLLTIFEMFPQMMWLFENNSGSFSNKSIIEYDANFRDIGVILGDIFQLMSAQFMLYLSIFNSPTSYPFVFLSQLGFVCFIWKWIEKGRITFRQLQ